jgi:Zn finger protein HypA/HybF involved in hydrogenase expression
VGLQSIPGDVRGVRASASMCLSAVVLFALIAWLRPDEILPGDLTPREESDAVVCADCDKRVTPKERPDGSLCCPRCGGRNLSQD